MPGCFLGSPGHCSSGWGSRARGGWIGVAALQKKTTFGATTAMKRATRLLLVVPHGQVEQANLSSCGGQVQGPESVGGSRRHRHGFSHALPVDRSDNTNIYRRGPDAPALSRLLSWRPRRYLFTLLFITKCLLSPLTTTTVIVRVIEVAEK